MLHKTGKPTDLVRFCRPLSLTSCLGKRFEKTFKNKSTKKEKIG